MKKRILSILLAALLVVSLMPTVAFAADKGLGNGLGEGNAWDISASGDQSVLAWLEKTSETPTYILHIDGTGAMKSFSRSNNNLWYNYREKIESVIISNDITSIGDFAFYECSSLLNVIIPEKVTSIGTRSFYGCSKLTNVTIPSNVTTIGQGAFSECSTLTGVTFTSPSSIKTINSSAFENCVALTSLTIPESVTKIYDAVFSGCNALTEIAVEANNKNYLSEDGILFSKDNKKLICYPANKTGGSYIIPDTVTSINNYAFSHSNLNSVTLPKNLTYMGSYVFCECTNLASISIPSGVTSVGNYAFKSCSSLADVTCLATTPPTLGNNKVFTGCAIGLKITVPSQSIDAYKTATNWSEYANQIFCKHIVDGVIFEPWTNNVSLPTTVGNYYLDADVIISSTWNVPAGATPTNLDLNGHVIELADGKTVSVITVPANATLNLYDCGTTEHYFTVDDNGLWTLTDTKTELTKTVTGGVITGGNSSTNGGGVLVNGILNMNGGNITGNTSDFGGGIFINNGGKLTVYGGTICGNTAKSGGGGIYNYGGDTTVYGGTICDNTVTMCGGGIQNNGTLRLLAAEGKEITITGNTATVAEGGVGNWDEMHLSGKVIIKDNICTAKYDETVNYPINLATNQTITIDGALTGSEIYITHANYNDDKHNTGILTRDYTTKNSGAKLNDFFHYDGPNTMVLNEDDELEVINAYTVTFDKNGGDTEANPNTIDETYGAKYVLPTTNPTRSGYTFAGWFTETSGGTEVTASTDVAIMEATTLYAHWTEVRSSSGGGSTPTVTVPVSGDSNSIKVEASVSGSTATVKPIKDADLAKVADGENVAIDLSGAGKNVDTAKIPTETVEKI